MVYHLWTFTLPRSTSMADVTPNGMTINYVSFMHEDINSPMSQNSKPFIIMTRSSRISKSRPRRADTSSLAIATTNPRTALKMNSVYKNHWKMRLQKPWEIPIHTTHRGVGRKFEAVWLQQAPANCAHNFKFIHIKSQKKCSGQNWSRTGSYANNTVINHHCCI